MLVILTCSLFFLFLSYYSFVDYSDMSVSNKSPASHKRSLQRERVERHRKRRSKEGERLDLGCMDQMCLRCGAKYKKRKCTYIFVTIYIGNAIKRSHYLRFVLQ